MTEEGRKEFKELFDGLCQCTPELLNAEAMLYPHEMPKPITNEAHFRRVWSSYREHSLRTSIQKAVDAGRCNSDDASHALKFLGRRNQLSVSEYVLGNQGVRPDLHQNEGFNATERVFKAIGLELHMDNLTAEPFEQQFWKTYDHQFKLTEIEMRAQLPQFISDPSSRHSAEALMEEKTQQLSA